MSDSYEFPESCSFVPGASGEPGRRTFFLQANGDGGPVSFKVEKQQVAALCEYFESILEDLPTPHPAEAIEPGAATEPLELAWTIGGLGVAWDEDEDRLLVVAEELVLAEDEDEAPDPATARFHLSRARIAAFVAMGNDLVQAGRPACRLCGRPIDVDGHTCPRLN